MKILNKILYDILLKIKKSENEFIINKELVLKYFKDLNDEKYKLFEQYLLKFYNFCFEQDPDIMLKEAIKFKY